MSDSSFHLPLAVSRVLLGDVGALSGPSQPGLPAGLAKGVIEVNVVHPDSGRKLWLGDG